ncbi:MAG: threonylcarbamoyl-AMP synthase [Thermosynechococcaceae cyanobacterium MS004]|nr:threonylcarbamoyl-AMP synthase [Thermosynechococcaceae cyanobacterium MS004]
MAQVYTVHPDSPQSRTIDQIRDALRSGAVMLYPTDTVYAIGCDLYSKSAVQRVRQIKQHANDKPLTFLCPSLSDIAKYAYVSDDAYRLMRRLIPGPLTFILPATKLVPKLVLSPKRKTTGIRVPDHTVAQALLKALDNPVISTSAAIFGSQENQSQRKKNQSKENRIKVPITVAELFDAFEKVVDIMVDNGQPPSERVSTVLDLCGEPVQVLRQGLGWETVAPLLD